MTIDIHGTAAERALVEDVFAAMPPAIPALIARDRIRFYFLEPHERFRDVNPKFASMDRPDSEIRTYGVYVPEHRIIIMRSRLRVVVAHEVLHHADACLAGFDQTGFKGMRSEQDPRMKTAYDRHRRDGLFVSHYSGVNVAEFSCEFHRAALGFSAPGSRRPDRERLARIDPTHLDLLDAWTDEITQVYLATPVFSETVATT
jgi:hypothetical protein